MLNVTQIIVRHGSHSYTLFSRKMLDLLIPKSMFFLWDCMRNLPIIIYTKPPILKWLPYINDLSRSICSDFIYAPPCLFLSKNLAFNLLFFGLVIMGSFALLNSLNVWSVGDANWNIKRRQYALEVYNFVNSHHTQKLCGLSIMVQLV